MRALLLLTLVSAPALAVTIQGPADVAALTAAADVVVRAQVVRLQSGWAGGDPQSGVINTQVELKPLETWKGAPSTSLVVLVPGGAVGEIGQIAQGAATFAAGDEVVVFLRRRAGQVFHVERWALGKFLVRPDSAGNPRALRSREGVTCRGCRPGEPDELSLAELKASVLAAQEAK
jgi:hypothetical protein